MRTCTRRLVPVIESRPGIESAPEGLHSVMPAPSWCTGARRRVVAVRGPRADGPRGRGGPADHLALLGILVANEGGLRANLDTEFLHDFRVAVRRIRSLLRPDQARLPAAAVEHFSTEFGWIGRLTGRRATWTCSSSRFIENTDTMFLLTTCRH